VLPIWGAVGLPRRRGHSSPGNLVVRPEGQLPNLVLSLLFRKLGQRWAWGASGCRKMALTHPPLPVLCRAGSAACVGTLTTTLSTTSPRGASLWWATHWSLETAGSSPRPARTPWCPWIPAPPTLTASPGPRNSAASSTVQPSMPATPMYGTSTQAGQGCLWA
jgi:hypothetical protein